MNIFERASRRKLRFSSTIGDLSTEQLWDLPLTTTRGDKNDLDKLARLVHSELKDMEEGSFVTKEPNENKIEMELRLEILKYVIDAKLKDQEARTKAIETLQYKKRLMAALASKEEAALAGMTKEQIEAELAKL